jgi:DNA-binding transcriptional LysR family regulator
VLDAHQLNVFLTAAETLNFTEAARLLNMTQPSVSQHIQTLEQHFQSPLFNRAGRQLTLTDAGLTLLPLARQMVRLSVRIDETMASLQGAVYGNLRIACSTTSGKYILPALLSTFLQRHPRVQTGCQVYSQKQAIEELREGHVHLALACLQDCEQRDLDARLFYTDPVVLLAPEGHWLARQTSIEPHDLLDARMIMREDGSATNGLVRRGLLGAGIDPDDLDVVLTLGNSEAIALAVQEGLGAGFVSQFIADRLVRERVQVVPVRGLALYQDVHLIQSRRHPPTKAQTAFWQFFADPGRQPGEQLPVELDSELPIVAMAT